MATHPAKTLSLDPRILGSRRPILFVEGKGTSLDIAIYRSCYPEWTVIPRGSCEEVIHSVVTMRKNSALTRVTCSGIVDADDYNADDEAYLAALRISTLSVSEIENVILLPPISKVIAEIEGYAGIELQSQLVSLQNEIFAKLESVEAVEAVVVRYCRRRIDRTLKKIDLSAAETVAALSALYEQKTSDLDISTFADDARTRIRDAIRTQNLPALLKIYDNKGLMAVAASYLKSSRKGDFEGWLIRTLKSDRQTALIAAIRGVLPTIVPE